MRKWIIAAIAAPVGLVAAVYGTGALLPRDHVARGEAEIAAPPPAVAALVRDVASQARWRSGVERVEVRAREGDVLHYIEHGSEGPIAFAFREVERDRVFESRIDDPQLPFAGTWSIRLTPAENGTRVSIEERGTVNDPLFRFFGTFVFGHQQTINAYLEDLKREFDRS